MTNKKKIPKYSGPEIEDNTQLMTKNEIKARFDNETASIYAEKDPIWIPEYKTVFKLLVSILKNLTPKGGQFIDLGAGTGNASLKVLKCIPNCHITLVDFSQNMLNQVDKVLADYKNRYSICDEDFHQKTFPANQFDGVFSTFAIHHTRGIQEYKKLYKNIFSWLKPNGVFACCDAVEGDCQKFSEINMQGWQDFLEQKNFSSEEIEKIFLNSLREDTPISLKEHINCLQQVGFKYIDIVWKRYNFALYVGIK